MVSIIKKVNQDMNKNFIDFHKQIITNRKYWDLFTKKEEYGHNKYDEHKRFSFSDSKHRDVLNPSISKYLKEKGYLIEYPDNKKFAVALTHDVDDIYVKNKHLLWSLLNLPKNRDFSIMYNLILGRISKRKTPYMNFKKIIEIEKRYNAISSFYFFADNKDIFGIKYDLEDLPDEISYILDENCEIGLHTGYYSYDSIKEIKKEKMKMERVIGQKIIGSRNHVLRFKNPDSWEILSEAGLLYDTTFGYHDMIGFRNGMCHPFQPFNLKTNKKVNILEIPLNIQDMTFLMYLKSDAKNSWNLIKNLIDKTEQMGGVLTILWHNWTFCLPASLGGIFNKEWTKLYEKILKYCYGKNAWLTNCKEIYNYLK
jgi:hypothetical protein